MRNAILEVECREQGMAAPRIGALPQLPHRFSTATAKIDDQLLWEFRLWL